MSTTLEQTAKLAPVVTLATFAVAVAYVMGTFSYVGIDWTSSLAPSDLLALSWKSLPFSLIGMGTGYFLSIMSPGQGSRADNMKAHYESGSKSTRVMITAYKVVIISIPLISGFLVSIIPSALEVRFGMISMLVTFVASMCLLQCVELLVPLERRMISLVWASGVSLIMFAYSAGVTSGSVVALGKSDDILTSQGTISCVSLIYAGERGVIYSQDFPKYSAFVPWTEIKSVHRGGCRRSSTLPKGAVRQ